MLDISLDTTQCAKALAALDYAERGFPVFPLQWIRDDGTCSCGDSACKSQGKHPLTDHGLNDASEDVAVIRRWWTKWPRANIGVPTGERTGLVVLDVDGTRGEESLAELERRHGPLPQTAEAQTGSGGRHLLFAHPFSCKVPNSTEKIAPKLDVRGDGGYIVVAPSVNAVGPYRWTRHPDIFGVVEMPKRLLEEMIRTPAKMLASKSPARSAGDVLRAAADRYTAKAHGVSEGKRNAAAFNLSGHLAAFETESGERLSEPEILRLVGGWNMRNSPPLDDGEISGVVHSAFVGNGTPRTPHVVHEPGEHAEPPAVVAAQMSQSERDQERWKAIPASLLSAGKNGQINWLVYGYLAGTFITMLTGLWKAGKTTFIAWLIRALDRGDDLLGAVNKCRVLVVSEEVQALWVRRRDKLEYSDAISFICRPFIGRPTQQQWEAFLQQIADLVQAGMFQLVIFDTISSLWPCLEENDAAKVLTSLHPLKLVSDAGAAVLVIHHPRKGDGNEGQASRGSGAFPGFVDVILELRRFTPSDLADHRRTITALSRFDETPQEAVIELTDNGYVTCGTIADAKRENRYKHIKQVLVEHEGTLLSAEGILERWPAGIQKPGERAFSIDLKTGFEAGHWHREGAGRKNHPYLYSLRAPIDPDRARNESDQNDPDRDSLRATNEPCAQRIHELEDHSENALRAGPGSMGARNESCPEVSSETASG